MIRTDENKLAVNDNDKMMWFRIQVVNQLKTRPPSKYEFFHITSNLEMYKDFSSELSKKGQLEILCFTLGSNINYIKYDENTLINILKYPVVISKLLTCSVDVLVFFQYFIDDIENKIFIFSEAERINRLKLFCDDYSTSFENEPDFTKCSTDDYKEALIWLDSFRQRFAADKKMRNGFSLVIEDIEKMDSLVNMVMNVEQPEVSESIIWRKSVLNSILYKTIHEPDIDNILKFVPPDARCEIKVSQFVNACKKACII